MVHDRGAAGCSVGLAGATEAMVEVGFLVSGVDGGLTGVECVLEAAEVLGAGDGDTIEGAEVGAGLGVGGLAEDAGEEDPLVWAAG